MVECVEILNHLHLQRKAQRGVQSKENTQTNTDSKNRLKLKRGASVF